MSAPIEPNIRELMRDIGARISAGIDEATIHTGERYGFTLLMFTFNKTGPPGAPGSINYISNAQRRDMIEALKEFIRNAEADEAAEDATRGPRA